MAYSQINYGAQGGDVRTLQQMLNKGGYNLKEDGIFGAKTLAAVKDYQKKNKLAVDGIVGKNTWAALTGTSKPSTNTATNTDGTVGKGFDYKDFTYDDFKYDKTFSYDDFSHDAYQESEAVTAAKQALDAQMAKKPGEYQSKWQTQLDEAINKILNREKFSYDFNGDALYQQYKDKYIQQGKMAMADTMGQAAAMTGGYGNSYAASVGNQAYQQSLQQLNDIVSELYQMAYDRYQNEGQDLYKQYAMLGDRENVDYGRYRDSVSDWQAERDYLTGRYDSERNFDYSKYSDDRNFQYNKYADDRNFEYGKYIDDRNYEYNKYVNDRNFEYGKYADDKSYAYNDYRDKIADAQWKANYDEALRQYNEQFAYRKDRDAVADSQWQKEFDEAMRQYNESMAFSKTQYNDSKKTSSSGSGGFSGSSSSGSSGGSGSNGGSGGTGNTGNTNNGSTGGVSSSIKNKASSFSNNNDLANYLDGLAASGVITESQADALYAENKSPEKAALNKRSWTLVDDGGVNWLWGVDNNAVVKDQYGNTYKLGKLVDALVAEGMSKSDAKAYVKKLQKQLGA